MAKDLGCAHDPGKKILIFGKLWVKNVLFCYVAKEIYSQPSYSTIVTRVVSHLYFVPFTLSFIMAKMHSRSRARSNSHVIEDCIDFIMLPQDESEINFFSSVDIELLRSSHKFPPYNIFKVSELLLRSYWFFLLGHVFISFHLLLVYHSFFLHWSHMFLSLLVLFILKVQILDYPR